MKNICFPLIIICLLFSCKREKALNENQNQIQADNILYHNIMPDTTIHSVQYFIHNEDPESCGDTPMPSDSFANYYVDINDDAINDFLIQTSHSPDSESGSIHCAHVVYLINIFGINSNDSISFTTLSVDVPNNYDSVNNNLISSAATWIQHAALRIAAQGVFYPVYASFQDTYIGVKVDNNYGWIHVAPSGYNGITIKEYAINLTASNPILAGQKH